MENDQCSARRGIGGAGRGRPGAAPLEQGAIARMPRCVCVCIDGWAGVCIWYYWCLDPRKFCQFAHRAEFNDLCDVPRVACARKCAGAMRMLMAGVCSRAPWLEIARHGCIGLASGPAAWPRPRGCAYIWRMRICIWIWNRALQCKLGGRGRVCQCQVQA